MMPFQHPVAELRPDPANPLTVGGLGPNEHSLAEAEFLAQAIVAATCGLWQIDLGLISPFKNPIVLGSRK